MSTKPTLMEPQEKLAVTTVEGAGEYGFTNILEISRRTGCRETV